MSNERSFTPREIVSELDKYIVGQADAKRAVAIALRNRWRRQRVDPTLRDEIAPKNIILIGSTGVGKTEIARRLAKLADAPFIKVEASKFTEVGYVGRDVESIVRDLMEVSVKLVREEAKERVKINAEAAAEERVLDLLLPKPTYEVSDTSAGDATRDKFRTMLRNGELDDRTVEADLPDRSSPMLHIMGQSGMEDLGANIQEMMSSMMGRNKTKRRQVPIREALEQFTQDEAAKLIDQDAVNKEAILRAENSGIVFLDEIDKIAKRDGHHGGEVSREGVQRDILPIVEGSTVTTKYGQVKTDHVLFIAAGAFHFAKVSDLIPELQGRFPIRVELDALSEKELLRILKEPQNALPIQYQALLQTEGVTVEFEESGLQEVARLGAVTNEKAENIGARRLHTLMEKLLEEISFDAPERRGETLKVDQAFVQKALGEIVESDDLTKYIL